MNWGEDGIEGEERPLVFRSGGPTAASLQRLPTVPPMFLATLSASVLVAGRSWGRLGVVDVEARAFSQADVDVVHSIAPRRRPYVMGLLGTSRWRPARPASVASN